MVRENPTASLASLASGQSFALTGGTVILEDGSQSASDIIVGADGRIVAVEPFLDTSSCGACVDIAGMLVTPGFLDAHQHLDKTGVLRFTPNPSGTLQGAREAFALYARNAPPEDVARRAERTMARCLARGTTAIRSHVNVDKDAGFHGIETLAGVRDAEKDRITLQLVAFMTPHPGQDFDWLGKNIDGAVALADAVGGTPAVSEDPPRYLDILFSAAVKAGKPVDLHLDEHLNAGVHLLDAALDRVRDVLTRRVAAVGAAVLDAVAVERDEVVGRRARRIGDVPHREVHRDAAVVLEHAALGQHVGPEHRRERAAAARGRAGLAFESLDHEVRRGLPGAHGFAASAGDDSGARHQKKGGGAHRAVPP